MDIKELVLVIVETNKSKSVEQVDSLKMCWNHTLVSSRIPCLDNWFCS